MRGSLRFLKWRQRHRIAKKCYSVSYIGFSQKRGGALRWGSSPRVKATRPRPLTRLLSLPILSNRLDVMYACIGWANSPNPYLRPFQLPTCIDCTQTYTALPWWARCITPPRSPAKRCNRVRLVRIVFAFPKSVNRSLSFASDLFAGRSF